MELQTFDLLWLPEPIETCNRDDSELTLHDAELTLRSETNDVAYVVRLAHCPTCHQWYGLLQVAERLLEDAGLHAAELSAFRLEDEPVAAGVYLPPQTLAWDTFGEHMHRLAETQKQPTPSIEAVQTLPQSPTTWEVAHITTGGAGAEAIEREHHIAIVHGPHSIRSVDVQKDASFEAEHIAVLIRRAAGVPQPPGQPGRPHTVRLADTALADALRPLLAPLDIQTSVGETPLADAALHDITALLSH
jgi:hypothetical protein